MNEDERILEVLAIKLSIERNLSELLKYRDLVSDADILFFNKLMERLKEFKNES